jgi:pimeloyl-ACP methyl ester carboxylesterase
MRGPVTLVGHSFGGILALHYAAAHPDKVSRVLMVSTPLDFPATLRTIRRNARARYGAANPQGIAYLDMIDKMDPASTDYAGYTFAHGIASGLYMAPALPPEARARYRAAMTAPEAALLSDSAQAPFLGFVASEAYTTRSFADLATRVSRKTACTALCGSEDGLFDAAEFDRIRAAIGAPKLTVVPGAAHLVFADQQPAFLDFLGKPNATA